MIDWDDMGDKTANILIGLVIAGVAVGAFFGIRNHIVYRAKCTDNGGKWVDYNCRQVSSFECHYDFNGHLQECHTESHEHCDEKCVGASAEAQ